MVITFVCSRERIPPFLHRSKLPGSQPHPLLHIPSLALPLPIRVIKISPLLSLKLVMSFRIKPYLSLFTDTESE